jgi:hypothetical protein
MEAEAGANEFLNITRTEIAAAQLVPALESMPVTDYGDGRDAHRYAARLRFALARVDELRRNARMAGGPPPPVFEGARLEVAMSILETHTARASGFLRRKAESSKRSSSARNEPAVAEEEFTAPGAGARAA